MAAPVHKGEEVELRIDSLAYGGNGVGRLDGFVVFVRGGLPGDLVRARATKVKRGFAEAIRTELLEPGPGRVDAPCRHFGVCGGCRFQDLAYERQLDAKHDAGARRARPPRRVRLAPARADRARAFGLRLPEQAGVLVRTGRRGARARLPPRRSLGRGDRRRGVPPHDGGRQRGARGGRRVGAVGRARGLRPGDAERVSPAPRRPRGQEHGTAARHARDRAGRAVRHRLPHRDAHPVPGGALDPLGRERPARRGDEPADEAPVGRGVDRGGAPRAPLPRAPERVPADEHGDGRDALHARARGGRR